MTSCGTYTGEIPNDRHVHLVRYRLQRLLLRIDGVERVPPMSPDVAWHCPTCLEPLTGDREYCNDDHRQQHLRYNDEDDDVIVYSSVELAQSPK